LPGFGSHANVFSSNGWTGIRRQYCASPALAVAGGEVCGYYTRVRRAALHCPRPRPKRVTTNGASKRARCADGGWIDADSHARAVIVAEQITARFFNVRRLLNRAVPIIAIKLSAFLMDDCVVLHPVTVLDVIEETADLDDVAAEERVDRAYWEKKSSPVSPAITDKIISLLRTDRIDPRVTYNRHHIAMGTTGYNFCWLHPRKAGRCHMHFRAPLDTRDSIVSQLQTAGIDAYARSTDYVAFSLTEKGLEEHATLLRDLLRGAESASRV
jgi:hypothetical protein